LSYEHLKVGDVVLLRDANENRLRRPNWEPPRATVVRVGRKYLYTGKDCPGYDRATGRRNDSGVGCRRIQTLEEHGDALAAKVADERLFKLGLVVHRASNLTGAQRHAIADAVAAIVGA
jgi:hypothetical protein